MNEWILILHKNVFFLCKGCPIIKCNRYFKENTSIDIAGSLSFFSRIPKYVHSYLHTFQKSHVLVGDFV